MDGTCLNSFTINDAQDLLHQLWHEVKDGDPERLAALVAEKGGGPEKLVEVVCCDFSDYVRGYLSPIYTWADDAVVRRFAELLAGGHDARWIFDFLLEVAQGKKQLGDEPAGAE